MKFEKYLKIGEEGTEETERQLILYANDYMNN